jgi:hypothetical protein
MTLPPDPAEPAAEPALKPEHPAGQEAPPPPELDPTKKTSATHDPTAADPGNGAD